MTAATTIAALLAAGEATVPRSARRSGLSLSYAGGAQGAGGADGGRLNAIGIGRGDRVAIVLPNGPEMATAFLAVACGATTAPLNPAYRGGGVRVLSLRSRAPGP